MPRPARQRGNIMTKTDRLTAAALDQFIGTEHWYRHGLVREVLFTDGAKYVADTAGAYWLLDEIAFAQQSHPHVAAEPFQVWTLTVHPDHTAVLSCGDGNGTCVHSTNIAYTDFPLPEITFYYSDRVILLPGEW
jgi:hypothetical protein